MTIRITMVNGDVFFIHKDEDKGVMLLKKFGFPLGEIKDVGTFDSYNLDANVGKTLKCRYVQYNIWGECKGGKAVQLSTDSPIESVVLDDQ